MFSRVISVVCLVTITFLSTNFSFAQVGVPPSQRSRTGQSSNQQQPKRPPTPKPTAEDILQFLFPPEQPGQQFQPNAPSPRLQHRVPSPRPQRGVSSSKPLPRILSPKEVALLPPYQQRALLRKGLQSFDESLDKIETGAAWKRHLQIDALGSGLWCGQSVFPSAQARTSMVAIADRFNEVAGNSEFKTIHSLWGFQTIHFALREYAIEPVELSKRKLRVAASALRISIEKLKRGASWNEFLQTDELTRLAASKAELTSEDGKVLQEIIRRFEKVDENPEYHFVSSMNGFKKTQSSLEKLADQVMQLKGSTPLGSTPRMLTELSQSHHAIYRLSKEKRIAQAVWEKAVEESAKAELVRKLLMAMQKKNEEEEMKSQQQFETIQNIVAAMKEKMKRASEDPSGRLSLLSPNEKDTDQDAILAKLVSNMRTLNRLGKEKGAAQKAWEKAAADSAKAELTRKMIEAFNEKREAEARQLNKVSKMITSLLGARKRSSSGEPVEAILMQFNDVMNEPAEVMLMQFEDVMNEPVEAILMQFNDVINEPVEAILMQFNDVKEEPVEAILMQFEDVEDESLDVVLLPLGLEDEEDEPATTIATFEEIVTALAEAPDRPEGFTEQQSQKFDQVVDNLKADNRDEAEKIWKELVAETQDVNPPLDIDALIQSALREAYLDSFNDLQNAKEKVEHYNELEKELREHLTELREIASQLDADSRVKIDTIEKLPEYRSGRRPYTFWKQQTITRDELDQRIKVLEMELEKIVDESRQAKNDLQDHQEKQQQAMQELSDASMMLHDSAAATLLEED